MPTVRNTFVKGKMNLDVDERLLQKGEYRTASNIRIANSEGSDVGAIEKTLSNKQLTNLFLGNDVKTIGGIADEYEEKLYWLVKSDLGSYIIEFDVLRNVTSFVLKDTRLGSENVLQFDENYLVTGIVLILDTDSGNRFLIFTDNNTQPKCVNINRAKTYGENNFTEEEILLIKKPPLDSPKLYLGKTATGEENNIEEKFLRFFSRFKYLDGEYSAFSPGSEVAFKAKDFSYDYATSTNESMINAFSKVDIGIDTGGKLVTDVDLIFVECGKNIPYLVGSYNKKQKGWEDNQKQTITFSNNKVYKTLSENQLYRLFDNIPLKAKALDVINNFLVFGNYTENFNIEDEKENLVLMDYTLQKVSTPITKGTCETSLKSNRVLECGLVYGDEYGRLTTVLNSENNTVLIPVLDAINKNKLQLTIHNKPPKFAKFYRVFVKQNKDNYDTIIPTLFYEEGVYLWVKIEKSDVDKVKEGDFLVVKSGTRGLSQKVIQTKVLEVKYQERNFLENSEETDLKQLAGNYIKIKPNESYKIDIEDVFIYRYKTKETASGYTVAVAQNGSYIQNPIFYGVEQDDLSVSGTYTGSKDERYTVFIDSIGDGNSTFDTFSVKNKEGITLLSNEAITANTPQLIEKGVSVTFLSDIGHTLNDRWTIMAKIDFNPSFGKRAYGIYRGIDEDFIRGGSRITFIYDEYNERKQYRELPFTASKDYENIEEWYYEENIEEVFDDKGIAPSRIWFRRGNVKKSSGENYVEVTNDGSGTMNMIIRSLGKDNGPFDNNPRIKATIEIRYSESDIIFETKPTDTDTDIFYEEGLTYPIENGLHLGLEGDTNQTENTPAVITLPTFNCFSWGNGVESIKIKDSFNGNKISIATRPLVPIENYRENKRIASLTYGQPYDQTLNYNGLNEFNQSRLNFKDLDDRYGSIQRVMAYDTDLDVWQEDKTHRVLYGKSTLYNEDGTSNVGKSNLIFDTVIPYAGEFGISKHPESLVKWGNYRYWVDAKRGVVLRKGQSGIEIISKNGMRDWFRDFLRKNYRKPIFGAFDPYNEQYAIRLIEDNTPVIPIYNCGNEIIKSNQTNNFTYYLQLNDLSGDIVLPYNITEGEANITAEFNNNSYSVNNATGIGEVSFVRDNMNESLVKIKISPVSSEISYTINNTCPYGETIKIIHVVVGNSQDIGKSISSKFKWGASNYYVDTINFNDNLISLKEYQGIAGVGRYPLDNNLVQIQSYKDELYNAYFDINYGDRLGYLISDTVYDENNINDLLLAANYPTITHNEYGDIITDSIEFTYNKTGNILYLIWDYSKANTPPVANNDTANVQLGQDVIIDVLGNDIDVDLDNLTPIIVNDPEFGILNINPDKTITYTHNGSENYEDSFTYKVNDGNIDSNIATVNIVVNTVSCESGLSASGNVGIYEILMTVGSELGTTGINYNAQGVPDRFQIEYDGVIVADSKYVGDGLAGDPPTYSGLIATHTGLVVKSYDGTTFNPTGETRDVTVTQSDIANGTSEPTAGAGVLTFEKTTATPTVMKIIVTAPVGGTAWNLSGICPYTPS